MIGSMDEATELARLEQLVREQLAASPGCSLGDVQRAIGEDEVAVKEAISRLLLGGEIATPPGQPRYWLWPSIGVRVLAPHPMDAFSGALYPAVTIAMRERTSQSGASHAMVTVRFDEDGIEQELVAQGVQLAAQ